MDPSALESVASQHGERLATLLGQRTDGALGFMDLPDQSTDVEACQAFAEERQGRFENVVVLGIGGSALGTQALHAALSPPLHELKGRSPVRPRLFVVDNIDPELVGGVLRTSNPTTSLFIIVSKSGSTAETMSQFLFFLEALKTSVGDRWDEHVAVITDATEGHLRPFADAHKLPTFTIPSNVGGRFSVLSPVGLLPGACMNWDLADLLAGAALGRESCLREDFSSNPAAVYAACHYLLDQQHKMPIQVLFPYSHRLRLLADWNIQLVAESLGKLDAEGRGVGPTPHRALGATDQHSQVQLFTQGPMDKVFTFLRVVEHSHDVEIPSPPEGLDALDYLGGKTFGQLLDAECQATHLAVVDAGRPSCVMTFPRVDAAAVGEWLMWMEMATTYGGLHYGVNAFDQPGVEAGKRATYGLMGREGFEEEAERVKSRRLTDPDTTVW